MAKGSSDVIDRPTSTQESSYANRLVPKTTIVTAYSGPIPAALELREYERTLPGAADRIIKMAENENNQRHKIERDLVDAAIKLDNKEVNERIMGLCFAFIIIMFCVTSGLFLLLQGKTVTGTIFSGAGIASIIAALAGFLSRTIIKLFKK